MFQFPRFTSTPYVFRCRYHLRGGFPHSDICGSMLIANSPQLFAGCHVLLRLLVPRHPPDALLRLIHLKQPDINSFMSVSSSAYFQNKKSYVFYPGYLFILLHSVNDLPFPLSNFRFGGDERTRTADPLLAKQVLYQLSYIPFSPSPPCTSYLHTQYKNGGPRRT